MTRNDYVKIVKVFGLSILCALPIVIILDLIISPYVSMVVLTTIDVVIFVVASLIGYLVYEKRQKYIARKREEIKRKKANNKPDSGE
ncbi:MAG: hypothetical protein J6C13_02855 [Clostridia bacterium]|nr:hypothetical protein [Clostridia bacterium]